MVLIFTIPGKHKIWESKYIHYKVWGQITYPFSKFSGAAVEYGAERGVWAPYPRGSSPPPPPIPTPHFHSHPRPFLSSLPHPPPPPPPPPFFLCVCGGHTQPFDPRPSAHFFIKCLPTMGLHTPSPPSPPPPPVGVWERISNLMPHFTERNGLSMLGSK